MDKFKFSKFKRNFEILPEWPLVDNNRKKKHENFQHLKSLLNELFQAKRSEIAQRASCSG